MIESIETIRKNVIGPHSTSTPIAIGCSYDVASDIKVDYFDEYGTKSTFTLNVDYTITGSNLYLVVALTSGEKITIYRDTPLTQERDYQQSGIFPAEEQEKALDKLTRKLTEINDGINRALKFSKSITDYTNLEINTDPVAGGLLGWDSTATYLETKDPTSQNHVHSNLSLLEGLTTDQFIPISHRTSEDHDDRYYTEDEIDAMNLIDATAVTYENLNNNSDVGTGASQVAAGNHTHSGVYEPVISKNTAFNKNFGNNSGEVCEGNDGRLSDARTPVSHGNTYHSETFITAAYEIKDFEGMYLSGSVADGDYIAVLNFPFGGTINKVTTKAGAGTGTATFKINSTALGGSANSVSTSENEQSHSSDNTFSVGDDIIMTISSASGLNNLTASIEYTRSLG